MMPLDEFNSWNEMRYLLASPANAMHLRRSIKEGESARAEVRELLAADGRAAFRIVPGFVAEEWGVELER
jgi:hypothetical protein